MLDDQKLAEARADITLLQNGRGVQTRLGSEPINSIVRSGAVRIETHDYNNTKEGKFVVSAMAG